MGVTLRAPAPQARWFIVTDWPIKDRYLLKHRRFPPLTLSIHTDAMPLSKT
jgi:hypothetical protein